jgi:hypothetical protein
MTAACGVDCYLRLTPTVAGIKPSSPPPEKKSLTIQIPPILHGDEVKTFLMTVEDEDELKVGHHITCGCVYVDVLSVSVFPSAATAGCSSCAVLGV